MKKTILSFHRNKDTLNQQKRILVAPLNWGLGHASRCIPIIENLVQLGAAVMLASDGRALALLKKEFPQLPAFELPGYDVRYEGNSMVWNIATQLPKISRAIYNEKKVIKQLITSHKIDMIISDNRYGCRSSRCENIFITHQINIAIPNLSLGLIVNKINHHFINYFDQVWIPDFEGKNSLAGKLSSTKKSYTYIGSLSRFKRKKVEKIYDLIVVLSGPEPQRSILETKIIAQLKTLAIKAVIVQGKTERQETTMLNDQLKIISFLTSKALNEMILQSNIVIARSGYSTIMDLVALGKKAILVPTPGQTEQEYLAERLLEQGRFYFQTQDQLNIKKALEKVKLYRGFESFQFPDNILSNLTL